MLEDYEKRPKKYRPKSVKKLIPEAKREFFTEQLIDIFDRMFVADPEDRITITQLLQHSYFQKAKKIPPMFQEKRKFQESKKKPSQKANN